MAEALYRSAGDVIDYTPAAAISAGQVISLPDGRAAVSHQAIDAGVKGAVQVGGKYTVAKTAGVVCVAGCEMWWDHSANSATCVPPTGASAGDKDFYLGTATEDATSAATTCEVALNIKPSYIVDLPRSSFDTAVVLTAGAPYILGRGGSTVAGFSATAEAQKLDLLSERSFPVDSNWVLEAVLNVVTNADADVADLNVGVANATHASDADSITESNFFHFDMGADLDLDAESDDGTTEVAATDTTINWAVGTPIHLVIDGRDHTDIQMYVNGVLVLGATTFTLAAATGPLKALFHLEKSSNDSPGEVRLDRLTVRIANE